MITVYLPGSTNFAHNGEGVLRTAFNASVKTVDNSEYELSFDVLLTDRLFDFIEEDYIVRADASPYRLKQAFRIYNISKAISGVVNVKAQHISYDNLDNFIESVSLKNVTCEYALNYLFQNAEQSNNFKGVSDIINSQDYNIECVNVYEAIKGTKGSIVDTFGNGAKLVRDNFTFGVYQNTGNSNGVLLAYRKNLKGITATYDTQDVVTKIYPYATVNDEEGNQVKVTLPEKYVVSPYVGKFNREKIKYVDFSADDVLTVDQLRTKAQMWFESTKNDLPKASYKLDFIELSKNNSYKGLSSLQEVDLYDEVIVRDLRLKINATSRVYSTDYDPIGKRYNAISVGDLINHYDSSLKEKVENLEDNISDIRDVVTSPTEVDGTNFPNTLPNVPTVTAKGAFATVRIEWTIVNELFYYYEVYASQVSGFTPGSSNLIFSGQASSLTHEVKPHQTWYYKVRGRNSHGRTTSFSNQAVANTTKLSDAAEYFEEAAIGDALIGTLNADRAWVNKFSGETIDARNLIVQDGSGNRTLYIDSFGRVYLNVTEFHIENKSVVTEEQAVQTVKVMYYLSTSKTQLAGGTWQDVAPEWTENKYMWSKTVTTMADGKLVESSPTCIAGATGQQGLQGVPGVQGPPGSNGQTLYTWVKYADSASGSGMSDLPTDKEYIGFAYNKTTSVESTNPSDYTWSLILGPQGVPGEDGTDGVNGTDGKTYYTWLKYADTPTTGMSDSPTGKKYMGLAYNKTTPSESTNYSDYSWSLIQGAEGATGATGTGVESVTAEFYLSTSKTTQTGGSWTTTPPTWTKGKYMWTRSKIVYKNPASTVYTVPIVDSAWEVVDDVIETTKTYTDAQVEVLNDSISLKASKTEVTKEITTAVDGVDIGGKNLVTGSDKYIESSSTATMYGLDIPDVDAIIKQKGKTITISVDVDIVDAQSSESNPRVGAEFAVNHSDGSIGYYGVWERLDNTPRTLKTRMSRTYTVDVNKDIVSIRSVGVYIQRIGGGKCKAGRLKIELGNKSTDWTPAPEDVTSEITTKVNEAKAEIKIETDKITQSVSELDKQTSVNLISNSNFASSPKYTNWGFWRSNDTGGWYEHQHAGFPTGEGIGLQLSKPNQSCTANSNSIPVTAGETYTVSMDLTVEKNVSKARISVREVHTDGTFGYEHNFDYATNYNGRTSNTFTVQGSNTKQINVIIWNMGATSETSSYVVVFFNRIQLQRGSVATPWKLSTDNYERINLAQVETKANQIQSTVSSIEGDYVGQSQMTQTVDKFEFNIKSRTGNKIRDSKVFQTSGAYGFGWKSIQEGLPSGTYTLTIGGSCGDSSGHLEVYAYIGNWEWSISLGIWTSYTSTNSVTFWLPPEHAHKWINIGSYNFPNGSSGQVRTEWYCLTQGDYAVNDWIPHDQEINEGITTVDKDGWKVSHNGGSFSRASASEFYQANENGERTLAMRYGGLRLYKWAHDKGFVGGVCVTRQGDADIYSTNLYGTGHTRNVSLGFAHNYWGDDQGYSLTPWIQLAHDSNGIYVTRSFLSTLSMRGAKIAHTDGTVSWGGINYMANGSYRYVLAGDQEVVLSNITSMSSDGNSWESSAALVLKRDDSIRLHSYHHWDFHGWNMYNMRVVSSLSAQSTYLKARTKDINEVYGVSSFTEGEIRYTDRKEYCTFEDTIENIEINGSVVENENYGKYTEMIEIPQILAENIELDYHVNISKLSWGDYRIIEKDPYYFIIESEKPNFRFTFEIVAKKLESPNAFVKIANLQYEIEDGGNDAKPEEQFEAHSKYAFMGDEEIEEELIREQIMLLKEKNKLWRLYSKSDNVGFPGNSIDMV